MKERERSIICTFLLLFLKSHHHCERTFYKTLAMIELPIRYEHGVEFVWVRWTAVLAIIFVSLCGQRGMGDGWANRTQSNSADPRTRTMRDKKIPSGCLIFYLPSNVSHLARETHAGVMIIRRHLRVNDQWYGIHGRLTVTSKYMNAGTFLSVHQSHAFRNRDHTKFLPFFRGDRRLLLEPDWTAGEAADTAKRKA